MSQQKTKFIENNAVTNAKLAQSLTLTLKGNNTGGTANVSDLTVSQVNTMLGDILANGTVPFSADQSLGSHKLTNVTDPTAAQDAATKNYVDASVAALNPATAVFAASTANISGTYNNGVAGVGATFTTTATGTFTIDGTTPALGARILIKDQTSGFQNGIYNITTLGIVAVQTVFTRSLDYNTASDMNSAGLIPVINGTVNALSSWQQVAVITTVGTDSLVFTEFTANPSLYLLKANNLNDVASSSTSFNNISGLTTLGDTIYGGASGTRSRLAGNTTAVKNFLTQTGNGTVSAAPAWGAIASADLPSISLTGDVTGSATAGSIPTSLVATSNATLTALLALTTATSLASIGTVTTGTWNATTIAVNHGGTGQTSYTDGQLLIGNTSGNTLTKATLTAGTGISITNGNGSISVASTGTATPAYTYVSQSTTLNPAAIGSYYLLSGASFTITLPTAASISGQTFAFRHNGTSLSQVYTFNTTSAQTINGIASGSYALYTNGETLVLLSDGSNWQILSHDTDSKWVSYTPTITGLGTVTNTNFLYRRSGSELQIHGTLTSGTAAATLFSISLPTSVNIDSTGMGLSNTTANPGPIIGRWVTDNASSGQGALLTATATSTTLIYGGGNNASTSENTPVNGSGVAASNAVQSYTFIVPISGWQP